MIVVVVVVLLLLVMMVVVDIVVTYQQYCSNSSLSEQAAPWDLQMVDLLRATVEKDSGKEATWWAK